VRSWQSLKSVASDCGSQASGIVSCLSVCLVQVIAGAQEIVAAGGVDEVKGLSFVESFLFPANVWHMFFDNLFTPFAAAAVHGFPPASVDEANVLMWLDCSEILPRRRVPRT
jgi:hypothetical protein